MNIYQLYHSNGNKFGFLVKKQGWKNLTARVVHIEGVQEGAKVPVRRLHRHGALFERHKVKVVLYGPGCFSTVEITLGQPWDDSFKTVKEVPATE